MICFSLNEFREKQIISLSNAVVFSKDLLIAGEALYTEVLSARKRSTKVSTSFSSLTG
jgi:hypothetical protein